MDTKFKVIIGLGNPGTRYCATYHNVGRIFVSHLAERYQRDAGTARRKVSSVRSKRFEALSAAGVTLVQTRVQMNLSGAAVRDALKTFRCAPDRILVAHDDTDIAIGAYKCAFGRGTAGHRGVESVIRELGTKNFWRLRIGIRKKKGKAGDFVLRTISREDTETLYSVFSALTEKWISNASF